MSRGIVEGKYIHIGNLIPKTALLSQKEALRESNFKRYGRRRVYTQRKFDSQKRPLSRKAALRESNFQRHGRRRMYTHRKFDSQNGLSSQKAALRESNFKRYGRRRMYTQRKFDSQNGPFEPGKQLYGNQISRGLVEGECIHIGI